MRRLAALFLFVTLFAACDPDFPSGTIICDPRSTGECPTGYLCMEDPEALGTFKCFSSQKSPLGYCGDESVQPEYEECDYNALPILCSSLGYYDTTDGKSTRAICSTECTLDLSPCEQFESCGDGIIQTEYEEQCDTSELLSCYDEDGVTLQMGFSLCDGSCHRDERYCYPGLEDEVDILFVVDSSDDQTTTKDRLVGSMRSLYTNLYRATGGMLNLHWGVASSALLSPELCPDAGEGELIAPSGCNLRGTNFMKDYSPKGCTMRLDPMSNACEDVVCDTTGNPCDGLGDENLQLVFMENGCPRCVNLSNAGEHPELNLGCMVNGVPRGCELNQPLAALEKALDSNRNPSFVRENALLVVVFLANRDDCSVEYQQRFFDDYIHPDYMMSSTQFKCAMGGLTCNQSLRDPSTKVGDQLFTSCEAAHEDDPERTLYAVDPLIERIRAVKGGKNIIALSLSGDYDGELIVKTEAAEDMEIPMEEMNNIQEPVDPFMFHRSLNTSCKGIYPAPRLQQFVAHFSGRDQNEANYSSCSSDYPGALSSIIITITEIFSPGNKDDSEPPSL